MICPQCKHENPPIHRFCGICGAELPGNEDAAPLDPAAQAVPRVRTGTASPTGSVLREPEPSEPRIQQRREAERRQTCAPVPRTVGVSGPSFLGLGSEDDLRDEPRPYRGDDLYRTNWGARILFALIILGVAAALGYTQWRSNHGLSGLFSRPAAPQQPANANAPTVPPMSNGAANPASGAPTANNGSAPANGANGTSVASNNGAGANPSQPNGQMPNSDVATAPAKGENSKEANSTKDKAAASATEKADSSDSDTQSSESSDKQQSENNGAISSDGNTPQSDVTSASDGKSASSAQKSEDSNQPVKLAEVYLEGQGVPQNCDEGVGILRAADARGNARAAIKLGAIYATGECVPMDRVIAYHYFSKAEQEDPRNQWVEENRAILWANMNDDERSRAKAADGE